MTEEPKGGRAAPQSWLIQRDSDLPVYAQLAEIVRGQIIEGRYKPGEKIPSENMLVEAFKVSPMTVRRAINLLAAQGVLNTVPGSGTYVKGVELGSAAFYLNNLKALFSDEARTRVKLLEARFTAADERVARKLQLEAEARAIYIRRLILVHDEPAFYHRAYLIHDPRRPIIEAELEVAALQGLLEGSGSALIKFGDLTLEASLLTPEEAQVLRLPRPTPAMMLEHIFYDFEDCPVSWGWFVCASDRLRLQTRIGLEQTNGSRDEPSRS